jgi:hypothetical protein
MTAMTAATVAAQARDTTRLELLVQFFFFSYTNFFSGTQHIKMARASVAAATAAQAQDMDNRCSMDKRPQLP